MGKKIVRNAAAMQGDARLHKVHKLADGVYDVTSGQSGTVYRVRIEADGQSASCTCTWAKYHKPTMCSHVIAVYVAMEAERGRDVLAWETETEIGRGREARIIAHFDGIKLTIR